MSWQDITKRDSIFQAMAEFDRLGRERFLARYHFGKSRDYHLWHDGKCYDSKAIVGVAHKYEFGRVLKSSGEGFCGGKHGAAKKLQELGFDVRSNTNANF